MTQRGPANFPEDTGSRHGPMIWKKVTLTPHKSLSSVLYGAPKGMGEAWA